LQIDLCKQKALLQEQEATLSKEIKSMIKKNNELNETIKNNDEQHRISLKSLRERLIAQIESISGRFSQILSKIATKLDIQLIGDVQNDAEVDEFLQSVQAFITGKEESVKNQEDFCKEIQNDLNQKKEALQFYQAKYNSLENERKELLNKAIAVKKVASFISTVFRII
jgi:exonuclease VII large subunit